MKLRTMIAATAVAAVAVPAAAVAQTEPVGGSTPIGGSVFSSLELVLTQPAKGFASFSKRKSYEMSFDATAITTDGGAQLSIADGDATSGSKLGHLSVGAKRLTDPLEARVGKSAFQALDSSVDPMLTRYADPTSRVTGKSTVKLRQKIKGKQTGTYRKLVLITLSGETP
jgi:hypothetical protein